MEKTKNQREKFGSRLGFLLISAGCAIGLGNVYRFPIITGAYGGAFFVLIYLAFLVLLGLPIMTMELAVGRASQRSIATSYDVLEKPNQKWHLTKYLGVGGNYLLMMFYTTIAGWFLTYFIKYVTGSMSNVTDTASEFVGMISSTGNSFITTYAIVIVCFLICAIGLQKGVEKVTKFMMIALFILMFGLAVYSLTLDGAIEGLKFYLVPNGQRLVKAGIFNVITAAMGQAFFTLSIGIGSIAIFGSYIGKERKLLGEATTIVGLDTLVAIMSGLIIFPAFFTFNATAPTGDDAGAGFLFITLSKIFGQMGTVGSVIGSFFFLFMIFAALSTVIAVFENIVSFWLELTHLKRWQVSLINIGLLLLLCVPAILSENALSDKIFIMAKGKSKTIIDIEDFVVSNLLLPIGSLIYVLFCTSKKGWGWKNYLKEVNIGEKGKDVPKGLRIYMSYVLPLIIVAVLIISIVGFFVKF